MDIVTLGAALNGSAEYVNSHFKGGSNIQIVDNPDGTQTINASGEVSSEDTVARAEIAEMKDGTDIDSFGDVETALATKADTSTTYTKTEVDTALGNKVDKVSGKGLSTNDYTTAEKTKLAGIAQGAEVNEIESIKVNNTTINPDANKVVNITVPTTAADVSALPDTTKYAAALSLTINSSTYVITGQLKDQNGDNLGAAQTIDLPLESVVVGGSYNSQTKKVVLTLQNGNTIEFSVADLVSGLQTELSASNKLNPAYINYDSTHRAVSDTEKSTWNGKQNAIDSSHKLSADLVDDTNATNKFATAEELEQIQTNKTNILSVQEQANWNSNSGVKNKLNYTGFNINRNTAGVNPLTTKNVTFKKNADDTISVYTTNAGASGNGFCYLCDDNGGINFKQYFDGKHILSCDVYSVNHYVLFYKIDGETSVAVNGDTLLPNRNNITNANIILQVYSGEIISESTPIVFNPMIRLSSISDSTYQPHAMSNAELTAAIQALQAQLANQ